MVYTKDLMMYHPQINHLPSVDPFFNKENVNYEEVFFSHLLKFQTQGLYPLYAHKFLNNYLRFLLSLMLNHLILI